MVIATRRFERDYRGLLKQHAGLPEHFAVVLSALQRDPYNRTRRHQIKKLEAVAPGDGQYRIRDGRFRFRAWLGRCGEWAHREPGQHKHL